MCVHTGKLLSHKKNEIMPFTARWMDLEIIILSEMSQKEKDKYHMISFIYVICELIYRNSLTDIENKLKFIKGKRVWEKGKLGVWD